ncbi:MAG: SNF2-related protein, partial [Sporichthyaceae bacterium]
EFLPASAGSELAMRASSCTCPVGSGCKHAVALLLSVFAEVEDEDPYAQEPEFAPVEPHWSEMLALLAEPGPGAGTAYTELGITLALTQASCGKDPEQEWNLTARLVRPGKKGWIAGDLAWNRIDHLRYSDNYDPAHVALIRELHTLHQASQAGHVGYYYGYNSAQRTIDLAQISSRAMWAVLRDLPQAGVPLMHAGAMPTLIAPPAAATLSLDVGACPEALAVRPLLRVGDDAVAAVPVLFTAGGHGAVLVEASALAGKDPGRWPLRLVWFAQPPSPALQSWAAHATSARIPAAEVERFRVDYVPRLRRLATLTSADGSFAPPVVSAPALLLRATFGDGHALDLGWAWTYDVDGQRHELPVHDEASVSSAAFRDAAAETALLSALDAEVPRALAGTARALSGLDTMRFHTETMPLLRGRSDLEVVLEGTAAHYREAGDAVAIAVSADERPGDVDWFDLGITLRVEDREVPFRELFVALSHGESHLLLPDGAYFSLDKPALLTLRRLITEAQALADKPDEPLQISRYQAGLWDELVELGVVERQAQAWQRQVAGLLELASLPSPPAPAGLTATLRPYQAAGVGWLAFLWQHGLGGVLADDMGLGKTVQALGLLCHARESAPAAPPFLIVAPTSVVPNWPAEAARFAPGLRVVAMTDTLRRSGRSLEEITASADVVITSYTLFRLDIEAWAGGEWSGLLLDEAQMVKNHQSQVHACARRLPAPFKLAITGTPMENNLMELWSMFSITAPGLFPAPERFKDYYQRPIEGRARPQGGAGSGAQRLATLRRRIRPLMLRRTKEQVAPELPAKSEQVLEVALHPRHRAIYDRRLARERSKVLGLLADMDRNRFQIFRSLTLLRRLSLHAGLADEAHVGVPSAKIDALIEHLRAVAEGGHRALVFSQFTGFLALVRERLDAEGIAHCYLDGSTRSRGAVISSFKNGDAPAFLISLKAGGFGLNLTEADYCFLLDPWWNPAAETQAVDRTHRIGQTRTVLVYRLLSADTIESKVRALAARKAVLFADVMGDDGTDAFSKALSAEDVRGLFE